MAMGERELKSMNSPTTNESTTWTRNRLEKAVFARSSRSSDDDSDFSADLKLLKLFACTNGCFPAKFVSYGQFSACAISLDSAIQALTQKRFCAPAFMLRTLELPSNLKHRHWKTVGQIAARAPLLENVGLYGDRSTPATDPTSLMVGLARNPSSRFCTLEFESITYRDRNWYGNRRFSVALSKLQSLRRLRIHNCSANFIKAVCDGLKGHPNLQYVCFLQDDKFASSQRFNPSIGVLLASLKSLKHAKCGEVDPSTTSWSFDLVEHLTSLQCTYYTSGTRPSNDWTRRVARLVSRATRLRELKVHIRGSLPRSQIRDLHNLMRNHPHLESLQITGAHIHVSSLVQCPPLLRLQCSCLPAEDIPTLLAHHSSLESLIFLNEGFPDDIEENFGGILHALETNSHVQELRLSTKHPSTPRANPPFHDRLSRTLVSNKVLSSLTMQASQEEMDVLAEVLGNNSSCLKHLCLEAIQKENASKLFQSLQNNTSLQSLRLEYAQDVFPYPSWPTLLSSIPHFITLERLEMHIGFDAARYVLGDVYWPRNPAHSRFLAQARVMVDDWAVALANNSSLISTKFHIEDIDSSTIPRRNYDVRFMFDYVCRLYSQRNRVQKMIRQGNVTPALWPLVLESLVTNPSALFLVSEYIPYPKCRTKNGNR